MKTDDLETIINEAFEKRQSISEKSDKKVLDAINESFSIEDLRKRVSMNSAVNAAWSIVHGTACLIASRTISNEEVEGYINGNLFNEISAIWAVGVSKPIVYR